VHIYPPSAWHSFEFEVWIEHQRMFGQAKQKHKSADRQGSAFRFRNTKKNMKLNQHSRTNRRKITTGKRRGALPRFDSEMASGIIP